MLNFAIIKFAVVGPAQDLGFALDQEATPLTLGFLPKAIESVEIRFSSLFVSQMMPGGDVFWIPCAMPNVSFLL